MGGPFRTGTNPVVCTVPHFNFLFVFQINPFNPRNLLFWSVRYAVSGFTTDEVNAPTAAANFFARAGFKRGQPHRRTDTARRLARAAQTSTNTPAMAAVTSEMKLDMDLGDAPALARGGAALRVARLTGARTRRRDAQPTAATAGRRPPRARRDVPCPRAVRPSVCCGPLS